jgi:hypothetical protein
MSLAAARPAGEPATPPIEVIGPQQTRPDRMICVLEEQTASRVARPRTCRRQSEWARNREESQRAIAGLIDSSNSQQFANRPREQGPMGPGVHEPSRADRGGVSRCGLRGPC